MHDDRVSLQLYEQRCVATAAEFVAQTAPFRVVAGRGGALGRGRQCTLLDGQPLRKALRREYRTLSDEERERFHNAVHQLKANGEFDRLARLHSRFAEAGGAHAGEKSGLWAPSNLLISGPAFLGWHREFTKR